VDDGPAADGGTVEASRWMSVLRKRFTILKAKCGSKDSSRCVMVLFVVFVIYV